MKLEWSDLPYRPIRITLMPFSKELALKARDMAGVVAVPEPGLKPIYIDNIGGAGLLVKRDTRYHLTLLARCLSCGRSFVPDLNRPPCCPYCGAVDEWFCADCQQPRSPLVIDGKALCPECKSLGRTRGLKRIQKFELVQNTHYETHYVVDINPHYELRVTDEAIYLRAR